MLLTHAGMPDDDCWARKAKVTLGYRYYSPNNVKKDSNILFFLLFVKFVFTTETIFHAMLMLGLPFGNDQRANIVQAEVEGYGLALGWDKIDALSLEKALNRLMNDPRCCCRHRLIIIIIMIEYISFKRNATRVSQLMRDELMPGQELAAYWIEHVLRHNGTKHLQLASKNLPFYQRHLIDVISLLVAFNFHSRVPPTNFHLVHLNAPDIVAVAKAVIGGGSRSKWITAAAICHYIQSLLSGISKKNKLDKDHQQSRPSTASVSKSIINAVVIFSCCCWEWNQRRNIRNA